MIEDFWNELNVGEIHARDSLQFELKSEFFINPNTEKNVYKQDFYLFIPNSLQINFETYSKEQFYLDQTNYIRYKTPSITLADLLNPDYSLSPLTRLRRLLNDDLHNQSVHGRFFAKVSHELKLFGAMFRRAVREWVYSIVKSISNSRDKEKISQSILFLCSEIRAVCSAFRDLQDISRSQAENHQMMRHFKYIDEFISIVQEEFLIVLLKEYRTQERGHDNADSCITELLIDEKTYRKNMKMSPKTSKGHLFANEAILYRQGLLHRFVLESLMLKNKRSSPEAKHRNILGSLAAGIAMMVYMTLFTWKGSTLAINSFPFVALAVVLYILKDRLKEWFKSGYSKYAPRWFPDFSTEITSFKGFIVGRLTENFSFIEANKLPAGFLNIRNHHFHEELQALHRHESIVQYKREMTLSHPSKHDGVRRREVTAFFRFNIHRFLEKAANAFQADLTLDPHTKQISERILPKVYHLNLIIREIFFKDDLKPKIEIKTFRVILDKNGIKRVEHIQTL